MCIRKKCLARPVHQARWHQVNVAGARPYYWNRSTGATQWECPASCPAEYSQLVTPEGNLYYWNHSTGATQWECPTEYSQLHVLGHRGYQDKLSLRLLIVNVFCRALASPQAMWSKHLCPIILNGGIIGVVVATLVVQGKSPCPQSLIMSGPNS